MAQNQTVETTASVTAFINSVQDETMRNDSFGLTEIFENATGLKAKMWGPAIVGFGSYHYKYESGREGDAPLVAFSPRKQAISLYLDSIVLKREDLLDRFGKYKASKYCIYFKKLSDINVEVLIEMINVSLEQSRSKC